MLLDKGDKGIATDLKPKGHHAKQGYSCLRWFRDVFETHIRQKWVLVNKPSSSRQILRIAHSPRVFPLMIKLEYICKTNQLANVIRSNTTINHQVSAMEIWMPIVTLGACYDLLRVKSPSLGQIHMFIPINFRLVHHLFLRQIQHDSTLHLC